MLTDCGPGEVCRGEQPADAERVPPGLGWTRRTAGAGGYGRAGSDVDRAQGLVAVLVILAACGMATRSGPWPGVVLAAAAGMGCTIAT